MQARTGVTVDRHDRAAAAVPAYTRAPWTASELAPARPRRRRAAEDARRRSCTRPGAGVVGRAMPPPAPIDSAVTLPLVDDATYSVLARDREVLRRRHRPARTCTAGPARRPSRRKHGRLERQRAAADPIERQDLAPRSLFATYTLPPSGETAIAPGPLRPVVRRPPGRTRCCRALRRAGTAPARAGRCRPARTPSSAVRRRRHVHVRAVRRDATSDGVARERDVDGVDIAAAGRGRVAHATRGKHATRNHC